MRPQRSGGTRAKRLSFVAMRLWNWLMPPIFGLHLITYWQTLGLLVLSRLLLADSAGVGAEATGAAA